MKCNAGVSNGKRKANQFALIKNKKKIEHVGKLGMLYDKIEAEYKQMPEDSPERADIKAKMDEIEQQIITMSAEINDEVFKTKRNAAAASETHTELSVQDAAAETTDGTDEPSAQSDGEEK